MQINYHKNRRAIAGVDWGFTNPGVILMGLLDWDTRLYIVREHYRTQKTIDWWIAEAKKLKEEFNVEAFACDPSEPAYIEQFKRAGLNAVKGFNGVAPGIDLVKQRLQKAADGRPRLLFSRNALIARDLELAESKRPTCTAEEIESYVWNTTGGQKKGEEPVKEDDHGLDALRYLISYLDLPGVVNESRNRRTA